MFWVRVPVLSEQTNETAPKVSTDARRLTIVLTLTILVIPMAKTIVTTAVSGFVNFEPLGALIIVLIGIGILEKTGFLKTFFTMLTRNSKKNTITFILVFLCLIFFHYLEI